MFRCFKSHLILSALVTLYAIHAEGSGLIRIYSPTGSDVSCQSGFESAPYTTPNSELVDEAFLKAGVRRIAAVYSEYSETATRPFGISTLTSILIDIVQRIKKEGDPQVRLRYVALLFPQVVLAIYTDYPQLLVGNKDPSYLIVDAFMDMLETARAYVTTLVSDKGTRLIDWVERLRSWASMKGEDQRRIRQWQLEHLLSQPGMYAQFCLERLALRGGDYAARYAGIRFEPHSPQTLASMAIELIEELHQTPSFFAAFEFVFPELYDGFSEMRHTKDGSVIKIYSQELVDYASLILRDPKGYAKHKQGVEDSRRVKAQQQRYSESVGSISGDLLRSWGSHNYGHPGFEKELDRMAAEHNLPPWEVDKIRRRLRPGG